MSLKKHFLSLTNLENNVSKELQINALHYLQEKHFYCLQIYENRSNEPQKLNIQSFKIYFNQKEEEQSENKIKVILIIRQVSRINVDNEEIQEQDFNIQFLCSIHKNTLCVHVIAGIFILKSLLKLENTNFNNIKIDNENQFDIETLKNIIVDQQQKIQKQKQSIIDSLCCQICLEQMKNPVLLPCHNHFLCYDCAKTFLKQQKQVKGLYLLKCPTCGDSENSLIYKSLNELKIFHAFLNYDSEYTELFTSMENQIKNQQIYIERLTSHLQELIKMPNNNQLNTAPSTPNNLKKAKKFEEKNMNKTTQVIKKQNMICIDSDDNPEEKSSQKSSLQNEKLINCSPDLIYIDANELTEMDNNMICTN